MTSKHVELVDDLDALFPSRFVCVLLRDKCGPFKMIILSAKQMRVCILGIIYLDGDFQFYNKNIIAQIKKKKNLICKYYIIRSAMYSNFLKSFHEPSSSAVSRLADHNI